MVLFIRICPILDADWNKTRPEKKTVHRRISTVYDSAGSIKNGPQKPYERKNPATPKAPGAVCSVHPIE